MWGQLPRRKTVWHIYRTTDYIPKVTNLKILRGHGIEQSEQKLPKRYNTIKTRTEVLPENKNTEKNILVKRQCYLYVPHEGGSSTLGNVIPSSLLQTSKISSEKKSACKRKTITMIWGLANNWQDSDYQEHKWNGSFQSSPVLKRSSFPYKRYLQHISFQVPPGPSIKPMFLFNVYPGK